MNIVEYMQTIGQQARAASRILMNTETATKNNDKGMAGMAEGVRQPAIHLGKNNELR